MNKSTRLENTNENMRPAGVKADDHPDSRCGSVPPLERYERRPEVEAELRIWYAWDGAQQQESLWLAAKGGSKFSNEALVHISRQAFAIDDRKTLNLAFEALAKAASPLLLSQAWGLDRDECRDQAQEILQKIFEAIRANKADFAEHQFAAFTRRKAVSLYRKRRRRFEGGNQRIEPTEEKDPIEDIPSRLPSLEAQALLSCSLNKLSPKYRAVFIQYHIVGLKQEEIAQHHRATVRTVYNWLKAAEMAMGLLGGNDDS